MLYRKNQLKYRDMGTITTFNIIIPLIMCLTYICDIINVDTYMITLVISFCVGHVIQKIECLIKELKKFKNK